MINKQVKSVRKRENFRKRQNFETKDLLEDRINSNFRKSFWTMDKMSERHSQLIAVLTFKVSNLQTIQLQ